MFERKNDLGSMFEIKYRIFHCLNERMFQSPCLEIKIRIFLKPMFRIKYKNISEPTVKCLRMF